jgi:hypothetical protein
MEASSTYYIYNENHQVIQIRTRLNHLQHPLYVIQHCQPQNPSFTRNEKIQYRTEFVDEKRFYHSKI